jgi:alpha-1,2-mannosyltransferase
VAAVAIVGYLVAVAIHPMHDMLKGFDLSVYIDGGRLALHDQGALYTWHLAGQPGIQYTYTPFAALLFAVASKIPFRALMGLATVVSLAALAATVWIAFRELGWRGTARIGGVLLVGGVALWLEPVQRALFLGQVDLVLMGAITWDMCQPDRRWWKGAATGVAAGINLIPLIFTAYLLFTRRFKAAAVSAGAFVATIVIGFPVLPHASDTYWIHVEFFQAGRTGFVGELENQSLRGILTRLAGSVGTGQATWLVAAFIVGVLGLAAATVLHRGGRTFEGLMACELTALLISPISWDHLWVWIAPGLAVLLDLAVRAGRGPARCGWLAAAGVLVAAFAEWPEFWNKHIGLLQGGLIWWAPSTSYGYGNNPDFAEYHWHGLQLIVGNLYVLLGCVLLVAVLCAAWTYRRHKATSVPSSALIAAPGTDIVGG